MPSEPTTRTALGGVFRWGLAAPLAAASLLFASLVGSTTAVQVHIAQFFHFVPVSGWLNHPLILLPWFGN